MNRRNFLALASGLLLAALPAAAQSSTWTIDRNHSSANFQIRHLGVSNVRGAIGGVTGTIVWDEKDPSKSTVTATLEASSVSTNNEARDKHLRSADFFNVEKFPTLTFKSTSVTVVGSGKLRITGDLTLAGVTKPVTLDVDGPTPPFKGPNGKVVTGFSATGVIKRSDFSFGSKFSEAMLSDEVKFTLDLEASKAN